VPLSGQPKHEPAHGVDHVADSLEPRLITKPAELRALCDRAAKLGCFAFDTEFIMEDGYETTVCLMQMATETEVALVDPLVGLDTQAVWELVADPSVEVVVHAGMEDLALCHQLTGKAPAAPFDVQIATGLVTRDFPLSLARLVRRLLHVRLHKSQTLTDWRQRPLSDAQLRYAVEDVAFLPAARRVLMERLRERDRLEWAREEFARFESLKTYEPSEETRLFRVKGVGSLRGEQLSAALSLLAARERLARQYNRPERAVLRDHLLVEIARQRWTRLEQIRSLRGLQLRAGAIRQLGQAVEEGLAHPRELDPTPLATVEDTPEEQALVALLTAVLRDFCWAENIAFSLLATKQSVRQLLHTHTRALPPASPLQKGWRAHAVGGLIEDILRGRCAVAVTGKGNRIRLKTIPRQT
jgi:ribonuclease D